MTSNFKTILLAGAAALVVALGGAAAAQAGGYGHSNFDSYLLGGLSDDEDDTYAASDSNPITEAVEAAATEAAVETLLGDGLDD
jgi:spermidine/putrescine-binding protein